MSVRTFPPLKLYLLGGKNRLPSLDEILALSKKLTGREPTPEEVEKARAILMTIKAVRAAVLAPSEDRSDDRDVSDRRYRGMNEMSQLLVALAFAADRHRGQRRKDADATPYVNHVIAVATILAVEGDVVDRTLLIGALLHDAVEDTHTTLDELEERFGRIVRDLVAEVSDDKTLPKEDRKRLQIERAPNSSPRAKQLKIADKIANVRDLTHTPPKDWRVERQRAYFDWAEQVVAGCRGENTLLDAAFERAVAEARSRLSGGG